MGTDPHWKFRKDHRPDRLRYHGDCHDVIEKYMDANRASTAYSAVETYEKSWKTYMDLLDVQIALEGQKIKATEVESAFNISGLIRK